MAVDAALNNTLDNSPLQELYTSREGNWYIALEVRDEKLLDAKTQLSGTKGNSYLS